MGARLWLGISMPSLRRQGRKSGDQAGECLDSRTACTWTSGADADLYSSTRDVLTILWDGIVPGTVMQFDEFFNTPEWRENEYKAFMEFVEENGIEFEYTGYSTTSQQVAVKIRDVRAKPLPTRW